jgi:FK506-binding nuclear protein
MQKLTCRITEINEVSEPKKALKSKAAKVEEKAAPVSEKKRKAEEAGDVSMTSTDGLSKNQKKKLAKKAKTEDAPAPAAAAPAPKEKKDIKAGKVRKA